jgi:hypothetical protein
MSELKTVYSKLFKTELASQKVELGLVDDINKSRLENDNVENSLIDEVTKGINALDNSVKVIDKAILSSKNVMEQIDKAKIIAKDLGVDLPSNIDNTYKYYQESIKKYTLMKNTISSFSSKIKSI